jgi:hypothetical protein
MKVARLSRLHSYTVEVNDIPMYLIQHHGSSEILSVPAITLTRSMGKALRVLVSWPFPRTLITGVPHRIKYYDMIFNYIRQFAGVVFMTGSEILDWYTAVA